jgi:hypothetical protein
MPPKRYHHEESPKERRESRVSTFAMTVLGTLIAAILLMSGCQLERQRLGEGVSCLLGNHVCLDGR